MTRSNKTPKNPAKSRIKSLKSVTPKNTTWRKWHNQPRLLARQAADERRYDRLFGRFDIIHHVTVTRSRFCVTFFVPTSVAANLFHQPVTPTSYLTRYINQSSTRSVNQSPSTCYPTRYFIHSTLQSIPSISLSAGDRYCLSCLWLCLLSARLLPCYRPIIV